MASRKGKNTTTTTPEAEAEVVTPEVVESAEVVTTTPEVIDTTDTTPEVITPKLAEDRRAEVLALGTELAEAKFITESAWWRIGWLMVAEFADNGPGSDEWIRREVLAALNESPAYQGVKANVIATQVSAALTTAVVFPTEASRVKLGTGEAASWSTHYEWAKDVKAVAPAERVGFVDAIRESSGTMAEVPKRKALEIAAAAGVPNSVTKLAEAKSREDAKKAERAQNRTGGNAPEAVGVVTSNGPTANTVAMAEAALESVPALLAALKGLAMVDRIKAMGILAHEFANDEAEVPEAMLPTIAMVATIVNNFLAD